MSIHDTFGDALMLFIQTTFLVRNNIIGTSTMQTQQKQNNESLFDWPTILWFTRPRLITPQESGILEIELKNIYWENDILIEKI